MGLGLRRQASAVDLRQALLAVLIVTAATLGLENQPSSADVEEAISMAADASSTRSYVVPVLLSHRRTRRSPSEEEQETQEYLFSAFHEQFHLQLHSDSSFVVPDVLVQHTEHNTTYVEPLLLGDNEEDNVRRCFYSGHVKGDPQSAVALSLCDGLFGHIRTSQGRYFIEPVTPSNTTRLHVIYRHEADEGHRKTKGRSHCSTKDYRRRHHRHSHPHQHHSRWSNLTATTTNGSLKRIKRSESFDLNIEVMIVADVKMRRYHGNDVQHYILTLMAIVALIYKDFSIGNSINISVVKLVLLDENTDREIISTGATKTLKSFCKWQAHQNEERDSSPYHHDTAILLTREDICRLPKKCDTLGLAELGTMCDSYNSCSIVEDNGLSAAFTIAHELGHVLNMPHDDDVKCKRFNHGKAYHVMARMLDYNTYPWSWSTCSAHYLTEFLDAGSAHCLRDRPIVNKLTNRANDRQPGELFNDNRQCELVYGPGAKICPYMPVCKLLWCMITEHNGCRTHHMPWADGTKCGENKWCHRGECKRRDPYALRSIDGRWGKWGKYQHCSRSCGGGIQKSVRECNNPKPSNGGKFCVGKRMRYKSCNSQECPSGSRDPRDVQCSHFNGKHFNIQGLPPNVTWVPVYTGIAPKDRCKLYCRVSTSSAYYHLKEKVLDGTPCSPDSFDICVNGQCTPAGCDHILNSSLKLDHCGVCGGDNSTCKTISGHYNKNVKWGYNDVVTIPAGSSNLDIRQHGHQNSKKDDNYIALKNSDNEYVLNGEYVVSMFKKAIQYGGTTLEYSGSDATVERVNSTKPLQRDLIIQVLSVGKLNPPDIHFQYTVSISSDYKWDWASEFSECSALCQGEKVRQPICVRTSLDRQPVNEAHCWNIMKKPPPQKESCNQHCTLSWKITHKSECSAHCGVGTRTLRVQCVQILDDDSRLLGDSYCSHLRNKPPPKEPCEEPCTRAHWEYGKWSECTKSCGGGIKTRMASCVMDGNVVTNDIECARHEKITQQACGDSECPVWQVGEWVYCSVTCGTGERHRPYWCEVAGKTVHGSHCDPHSVPKHKESCKMPDCPEWGHGPWGQCSKTCGKAVKMRVVKCRSRDGHLLDDSDCDPKHRPEDFLDCNLPSCPSDPNSTPMADDSTVASPSSTPSTSILTSSRRKSPSWRSGSWGECSVTCGEGRTKRTVVCYNKLDGQQLHVSECSHQPEPPSIQSCQRTLCGQWKTGEWNSCSVTCGQGVMTRRVVCILINEQIGRETDCDIHQRPVAERICNLPACPHGGNFNPFYIAAITTNAVDSKFSWRTGPWGGCSRSCGGGFQRRQVVCQDEIGHVVDGCDSRKKPFETMHCNIQSCPEWKTGIWGVCTRTCGGGIQRRRVLCQDHLGIDTSDHQCDPRVKPSDEQPCNQQSCGGSDSSFGSQDYRWQQGPWTSCSTTCGEGIQERQVVCVDSSGGVVAQGLCTDSPPTTIQNCTVSNCPVWKMSPSWSECSSPCGNGTQSRKPFCFHGNQTVLDALCSGIPPPIETRPCNNHLCPVKWQWREWSKCSKSCGKGHQFRKIQCVNGANEEVDERYCDLKTRPRPMKACNKHPCPFMWKSGDWAECSASCGTGIQTRTVSCHQVNSYNWINPKPVLAGCNETEKPSVIQPCNLGDCGASVHWKVGPWLSCSSSCNQGHQKRKVYCKNSLGNTVARFHCRSELKPPRKRKCFTRPCGSISCLDIKQRFDVRDDGPHDLLIRGKLVKVYCANMNSSYPLEYISLPSGESENFSEMYDKRLIRPDTCPYNGARRDSCECVEDARYRSGLTVFSKIRVNITSLKIVANDFAFSRQIHGQPIPYGEASDCYSSADCPQGRFSINLVGTGFIVSELTEWLAQGNKPSIKILRNQDGMRVMGQCGGYCGKCIVDNLVGLQLDMAPP